MLLIIAFSFAFIRLEPQFDTYGDALWYCFAIVTTIGFGDLTAVSTLGRVLSVVLGIYGILVVALITSIIVSFYMEVRGERDEEEDVAFERRWRNRRDRRKKGPGRRESDKPIDDMEKAD